ncbi:hypothetical protein TNCV_2510631 [Trichonephila clavipes]|nr:hypothetical protein TNCV_2510631 [Trichonephila clavipes]
MREFNSDQLRKSLPQVENSTCEKLTILFSGSETDNVYYLSCKKENLLSYTFRTATAGSDVAQSGRPIFDDFFQRLWPHIGNNTANVVFQMVKRLWLIRIDQ